MCSKTTINYTICRHQTKYRIRCPKYFAHPKQKCQKQDFESTYHHLCPKCSGVASPAPLFHREPEPETRSVFSDDTVDLAKEKLKEAVEEGLRKMKNVGVMVRDDSSDVVNVGDSGQGNARAEEVDGVGLGLSLGEIGSLGEPRKVASLDPPATAKKIDGVGLGLSLGRTGGLKRVSILIASQDTSEEDKEKRGSTGVLEMGKQKAVGKLKKIVGSLRGKKKPVVGNTEGPLEDQKLQISMPTPILMQIPSILEESPKNIQAMRTSWSSQQLAYDYQSIIEEHPSRRWSLSTDETETTNTGIMKELPFENMNIVSTWANFVEESIKRQGQAWIDEGREEIERLQGMKDKCADLDEDSDNRFEELGGRRGSLDEHYESVGGVRY